MTASTARWYIHGTASTWCISLSMEFLQKASFKILQLKRLLLCQFFLSIFIGVRDHVRSGGWRLLPDCFLHSLPENQVVLPANNFNCSKSFTIISIIMVCSFPWMYMHLIIFHDVYKLLCIILFSHSVLTFCIARSVNVLSMPFLLTLPMTVFELS